MQHGAVTSEGHIVRLHSNWQRTCTRLICPLCLTLFSVVFNYGRLNKHANLCTTWTAVVVFKNNSYLGRDWLVSCSQLIVVEDNSFWENVALPALALSYPQTVRYVGVIPFVPFKEDSQIPVSGAEGHVALTIGIDSGYDVIALVYFGTENMAQAILSHGSAFHNAWDALLLLLGYSTEDIRKHDNVSGFYSNAWYARSEVFVAYAEFLSRAIQALDHSSTLKNLLMLDSGYQVPKEKQELLRAVYGTTYVPLLPFVFERLPVFFFASYGASIYYSSVRLPAFDNSSEGSLSAIPVLPDGLKVRASFSLLGLGKSGSSALMWYLEHHPAITHVVPKELCFFDEPNQYRSLTSSVQDDAIFGDSCLKLAGADFRTHVLYAQFVLNHSAPVFLLIRNPLDRLYASYWYWCTQAELRIPAVKEYCDAHGGWNPRTTIFLRGYNHTFLRSPQEFHFLCTRAGFCAEFAAQLTRTVSYLKSLYGERLLLLSTEELYFNTTSVLNTVIARLGLPAHDFSSISKTSVNVNGVHLRSFISRKQRGSYPPMLPETILWANPFLRSECEFLEKTLPKLCEPWLHRTRMSFSAGNRSAKLLKHPKKKLLLFRRGKYLRQRNAAPLTKTLL